MEDEALFRNYHRVTIPQYLELLQKVGPAIEKLSVTREAISSGLRLSLTLRYLCDGSSMATMSHEYRISRWSVSRVISETTLAIWDALREDVLVVPDRNALQNIALRFEEKWNATLELRSKLTGDERQKPLR
ncbi:Protein adenylyltransferase [Frankliniella fusca]|uniref:Protein adenylyltransferase n=1 Tax=Frankliniella fusca TaxID=407009 RepID=A0AAE1HWY9_9NEOP|nr:Protein adenylyltransferase [Frankliniella fusca]